MPRFFVSADAVGDGTVTIRGADAEHLRRSLRVRPGERIVVVQDGAIEHTVAVRDAADDRVTGTVLASRPATGDPAIAVHVLLALAAQHMEVAVEGVTAAGAASIRPVITERTVPRPDHQGAARRVERWRSIALNAAQLAGRAAPADVHDVDQLGPAVEALGPCRILACVLDEEAIPLAALDPMPAPAAIVIGPEGGLGPRDLEVLRRHRATLVHIGPRTFPHHLAGVVAMSLLLARHGDLVVAPGSA